MTVQYFIDSENVGDFWIPLLELPAGKTELIVFYTRNSPHMSYDSLIRLKESSRTVTFIKCYEGTNALDFQLVSELGYRICQNEGGRFVIVTNDTGFDAAVKYWRRRKKSVKRITGKEAKNLERRIREDLTDANKSAVGEKERTPVRCYTAVDHDSDHDAHVDAYHAKAAQDPEGRPSRVSLRDAETAAQIRQEEELHSAEAAYAEEDLEMDRYEPEDEALNAQEYDPSNEEEHVPSVETDSESVTEGPGISFLEDSEEEDPEPYSGEEEPLETDALLFDAEPSDQRSLADRQAEIIQAYTDAWSEEPGEVDAAGDDSADSVFAVDTPEAVENVRFETEQMTIFSPFEENDLTADPAEEAEDEQQEMVSSDSSDSDSSGFDSLAVETASEPENESDAEVKESVKESESAADLAAENAGTGSDETAPAEESTLPAAETPADAAAEAEPAAAAAEETESGQHRSKSRRSRSRRSRSSAKKQETAPETESNGSGAKDKPEDPKGNTGSPETAAAEEDASAAAGQTVFDGSMPPGDEEIARIVACIGAENLAELHNQLATFYGDQGKDIYLSIKNNARSLPVLKPDLKQKYAYYCEIIFARSDYTGEYPADISEYLLSVREKLNNLNSLRYALQKHYGKEKGRRFYFLLKPFAKTMYQM